MDVVVWLRSLGLGKYEAAFRENEIDETVLPSLTHETLKELGVTAQRMASCRSRRCGPRTSPSPGGARRGLRERRSGHSTWSFGSVSPTLCGSLCFAVLGQDS